MTDTTIAPVVAPQATPESPPPQTQQPQPAPAPAPLAHTPGGWPVLPLAVTGANATTTLLAAAALSGGPAALAVATTGAAVLGATVATRTRRKATTPKPRTTTASKTPAPPVKAPRPGGGRVPAQPRKTSAATSATPPRPGSRSAGSGPKTSDRKTSVRTGRGRSTVGAGPAGAGRGTSPLRPSRAGGRGGAVRPSSSAAARTPADASRSTPRSGGGRLRGRLRQVRAVRDEQRSAAGSRAERRAGTTKARRAVADARRAAKTDARTRNAASGTGKGVGKGAAGQAAGRVLRRAGGVRSAAVDRTRAGRDRRIARQIRERRAALRSAVARRRTRRALRRSAVRFQGRRLLAALLAAVLGIVGMITTPLGRKLGWQWLQHPGRRLYARLLRTALAERAGRDAAVLAAAEEADKDENEDEEIGDRAERPAGPVPSTPTEGDGMSDSGFNFEEHAAEMENAAQQYDPDSAMEILAMVEALPVALTSVANVMRILAERSDSEFPLEKVVADGFDAIYGALMSTVAVAEDLGPLFREAHEQDIARHEDPRNGPEAEKGWNVS
ncbi:hypothetical protein [Streptomyces uncialis]|uniref:hypothetical protein n=1 Tax=Streptomyces uncialis TaxID=1048205 RepID=UPI00224D3AD7|nr:hypothetical protein [Streptomyces uncialis]MCX4664921.1 hypothetical protein [Streptomyces uncialis]